MKYIRLLLILFFLFPLSVVASSEEVKIKCPTNIKKGEEIECSITGSSSYYISGLELSYILPEYVEKINTTVDESWEGTEENNLFLLYTDENKITSFNIGSIKLKANKDFESINIKIDYLSYGDSEFQKKIIIDKENVNNVKNKDEFKEVKKNNLIKYVIIILIIGVIVVGIIIYIKIRSDKNEK